MLALASSPIATLSPVATQDSAHYSPTLTATPGTSAAHTAVLQERARIARELHDSLAQTLYVITLTASRALHQLDENDGKQTQQSLGDLLRLADTGQYELRSLLANIRSDLLMSGRLTAGLASLAADLRSCGPVILGCNRSVNALRLSEAC